MIERFKTTFHSVLSRCLKFWFVDTQNHRVFWGPEEEILWDHFMHWSTVKRSSLVWGYSKSSMVLLFRSWERDLVIECFNTKTQYVIVLILMFVSILKFEFVDTQHLRVLRDHFVHWSTTARQVHRTGQVPTRGLCSQGTLQPSAYEFYYFPFRVGWK